MFVFIRHVNYKKCVLLKVFRWTGLRFQQNHHKNREVRIHYKRREKNIIIQMQFIEHMQQKAGQKDLTRLNMN